MPHVSISAKPIFISMNLFSSFNGESYQPAGSSEYSHSMTMGIAKYRGKVLATGCGSGSCIVKTELMDITSFTWSAGPDYPFG